MWADAKTLLWDSIAYKDVLTQMFLRDLRVRYKHTVFGYLWSLLNPLFQLIVMSFVFSHLVRWEMKNYTLFLFSGLLLWTFFYAAVVAGAGSFVENEGFIRKIYLPKLLFPMSRVALRLFDFSLSFVALSLVGLLLGFTFPVTVFWLPVAIVMAGIFALGCAIIAGVATVYFRDFQYLLAVFLQMLQFATPILYPISVMPEKYQWWLKLNPLYSQVHIFQLLVHDGTFPSAAEWSAGFGVAFAALFAGIAVLLLTEDELVFRL